jgi:hypothetical protein
VRFGTVWVKRDRAKIVKASNWRSCVAEQTPKRASARESGGKPPHSEMMQTRSIGWMDFRSRQKRRSRATILRASAELDFRTGYREDIFGVRTVDRLRRGGIAWSEDPVHFCAGGLP